MLPFSAPLKLPSTSFGGSSFQVACEPQPHHKAFRLRCWSELVWLKTSVWKNCPKIGRTKKYQRNSAAVLMRKKHIVLCFFFKNDITVKVKTTWAMAGYVTSTSSTHNFPGQSNLSSFMICHNYCFMTCSAKSISSQYPSYNRLCTSTLTCACWHAARQACMMESISSQLTAEAPANHLASSTIESAMLPSLLWFKLTSFDIQPQRTSMFVSSFLYRFGTSPQFTTLLMASTICSFMIWVSAKRKVVDFRSLPHFMKQVFRSSLNSVIP